MGRVGTTKKKRRAPKKARSDGFKGSDGFELDFDFSAIEAATKKSKLRRMTAENLKKITVFRPALPKSNLLSLVEEEKEEEEVDPSANIDRRALAARTALGFH